MAEQITAETHQASTHSSQNDEIFNILREPAMIKTQKSICSNQEDQQTQKRFSGENSQERYDRDIQPNNRLEQWTVQQQRLLIQLHNQKGNKWVQIAKVLQRTDNSVKNHYHSRLRKALRKINKCVTDMMKTQFKPFKNNLLSRIIQTAELSYTDAEPSLKEEANRAFKLKNDILAFAQVSQQQIALQQITQVRKLVSQIVDFNKKYKKQEKIAPSLNSTSNKYKGKEIISLISQNSGKILPDAPEKICQDEEENSILNQSKAKSNEVIVSDVMNPRDSNISVPNYFNMYNPCGSFYGFYQQDFYPFYFPFYQKPSHNLFSGKASSFTYYNPENQKNTEQLTWASIPRIESEKNQQELSNKGYSLPAYGLSDQRQ